MANLETLHGTVALLRRHGGPPPSLEFELRVASGERRLVSTPEDQRHPLREGDQIVVTGHVDNESVLIAESISPYVPPVSPSRSLGAWLLLPPIGAAVVWVTAISIQEGK